MTKWEGCAPLPLFFQGGSLMNTITSFRQTLTTDGHSNVYNSTKLSKSTNSADVKTLVAPTGSEVAESIAQNVAEVKADAQQLQKMSDLIMGRKLQFNVNNELGSVVVKVVDQNTNQVLREIPSQEIQQLKINIRKAIGIIFDELI